MEMGISAKSIRIYLPLEKKIDFLNLEIFDSNSPSTVIWIFFPIPFFRFESCEQPFNLEVGDRNQSGAVEAWYFISHR